MLKVSECKIKCSEGRPGSRIFETVHRAEAGGADDSCQVDRAQPTQQMQLAARQQRPWARG